MALEILFIAIRSDTNIRGVRVEGHEIKLTSFADDATYFIKDETSARKLLSKIDSFSKISGLQINRSKSECLLLQFETIASNYNEKCLGIPVVETVKVLGHHFGHNKLICNYHNFYSKLIKIEKITQIWNQRNLTLFGKNILISALINSQILFNSQIETPPPEFLKMTEKLKKSFLWGGGIPKIAHHSIIGSISDGGINYKDTHSQINSLNLKFIINLNNCKSNRAILPKFWILNFFRKTSNIKEVDKLYFDNQIEQNLDIITKCYFKLPRKNKWKGHPFYFESLNTIQKVNTELPGNFYDLISTPIWYNKFLNTRFDCDLVKKGFIFIKDIVTKGEVLNSESIKNLNISNKFKKKILKICEKLPLNSKNILFENRNLTSIPFPQTTLKIGQINKYLKDLSSKTFYNLLIKNKIKIPIGMIRWGQTFDLSEDEITNAFMFPRKCTLSTKSWAFQYKIATFTLPTEEYLWNYKVTENYYCKRCISVTDDSGLIKDDIRHNLYSCSQLYPFISKVFNFFTSECSVTESIPEIKYLLGFKGEDNSALNCALLELKQYIFYNYSSGKSLTLHFTLYINRLRNLIKKEKRYYITQDSLDFFYDKWSNFSSVYILHGPDPYY